MSKNATSSYGIIPTTFPFAESPRELSRFPAADIEILRRLAERKIEIASDPLNLERKKRWYRHNALESSAPLLLAEIQGCIPELLKAGHLVLECVNPLAKSLELTLRTEIYQFETLRDDHVVEPWINVSWIVNTTGHVDESQRHIHIPDTDGALGARSWEPPIRDIGRDFSKLRPREFAVDREGSESLRSGIQAALGDIVPTRMRGAFWWTLGMTWAAIDLIGLENLMLFMYDDPDGLDRLMKFLYDDFTAYAQWLEREGLLSLNNENDYIGSGSMGYTRALPAGSEGAEGGAKRRDLWALVESQETVGVGPELFERFVFPHNKAIAEQFGLCYYGCCEPVNSRWHIVKRIKNLRSVSISPWADEEFMASELGNRYVYSRKPSPTMVSKEGFDEDEIRKDIRHTLDVARGCVLEIIMKDVHTLAGKPERLARWVHIAREESERARLA